MGRRMKSFARVGDKLYFIKEYDTPATFHTIQYIEQGTTAINEHQKNDKFASGCVWYVETGDWGMYIPENKYLNRLAVKLMTDDTVKIEVMYDGSGTWEKVKEVFAAPKKTQVISIVPRRCDYFRLRFSGNGNTKIFNITRTIEIGSDMK